MSKRKAASDADSEEGSESEPGADNWVQCDHCNKWRRLPASFVDKLDSNASWYCELNPNAAFASCGQPQELTNEEIDRLGQEAEEESLHMEAERSARQAIPAVWQLVRDNIFSHRRRRVQDEDDIMICQCKPTWRGGDGCGPDCINRMLCIECVPGFCPCEDKCTNQMFTNRQHAKLDVRRAGAKGFGLFALAPVKAGDFIIEYIGEVLEEDEYLRRKDFYMGIGQRHYYFMNVGNGEVIDACRRGNISRFINHSCEPNCETQKWLIRGELAIGLFATKDMAAGEELTFDYNFERYGDKPMRCYCGSKACRKYVGGIQDGYDESAALQVVEEDASNDLAPIMVTEQETDAALRAVLDWRVGVAPEGNRRAAFVHRIDKLCKTRGVHWSPPPMTAAEEAAAALEAQLLAAEAAMSRPLASKAGPARSASANRHKQQQGKAAKQPARRKKPAAAQLSADRSPVVPDSRAVQPGVGGFADGTDGRDSERGGSSMDEEDAEVAELQRARKASSREATTSGAAVPSRRSTPHGSGGTKGARAGAAAAATAATAGPAAGDAGTPSAVTPLATDDAAAAAPFSRPKGPLKAAFKQLIHMQASNENLAKLALPDTADANGVANTPSLSQGGDSLDTSKGERRPAGSVGSPVRTDSASDQAAPQPPAKSAAGGTRARPKAVQRKRLRRTVATAAIEPPQPSSVPMDLEDEDALSHVVTSAVVGHVLDKDLAGEASALVGGNGDALLAVDGGTAGQAAGRPASRGSDQQQRERVLASSSSVSAATHVPLASMMQQASSGAAAGVTAAANATTYRRPATAAAAQNGMYQSVPVPVSSPVPGRGFKRRSEIDRRLDSLVGTTGRMRDPNRQNIIKVLRMFNLCDIGSNTRVATPPPVPPSAATTTATLPTDGGDVHSSSTGAPSGTTLTAQPSANNNGPLDATASPSSGAAGSGGGEGEGPLEVDGRPPRAAAPATQPPPHGGGATALPYGSAAGIGSAAAAAPVTARQRARMADMSLLLDVVLKTTSQAVKKEFVHCGVLNQLFQAIGRNFSRDFVVILRKILRVLEGLPLTADNIYSVRSAHGTLPDVLHQLAQHVDFDVRSCASGLLKRYPSSAVTDPQLLAPVKRPPPRAAPPPGPMSSSAFGPPNGRDAHTPGCTGAGAFGPLMLAGQQLPTGQQSMLLGNFAQSLAPPLSSAGRFAAGSGGGWQGHHLADAAAASAGRLLGSGSRSRTMRPMRAASTAGHVLQGGGGTADAAGQQQADPQDGVPPHSISRLHQSSPYANGRDGTAERRRDSLGPSPDRGSEEGQWKASPSDPSGPVDVVGTTMGPIVRRSGASAMSELSHPHLFQSHHRRGGGARHHPLASTNSPLFTSPRSPFLPPSSSAERFDGGSHRVRHPHGATPPNGGLPFPPMAGPYPPSGGDKRRHGGGAADELSMPPGIGGGLRGTLWQNGQNGPTMPPGIGGAVGLLRHAGVGGPNGWNRPILPPPSLPSDHHRRRSRWSDDDGGGDARRRGADGGASPSQSPPPLQPYRHAAGGGYGQFFGGSGRSSRWDSEAPVRRDDAGRRLESPTRPLPDAPVDDNIAAGGTGGATAAGSGSCVMTLGTSGMFSGEDHFVALGSSCQSPRTDTDAKWEGLHGEPVSLEAMFALGCYLGVAAVEAPLEPHAPSASLPWLAKGSEDGQTLPPWRKSSVSTHSEAATDGQTLSPFVCRLTYSPDVRDAATAAVLLAPPPLLPLPLTGFSSPPSGHPFAALASVVGAQDGTHVAVGVTDPTAVSPPPLPSSSLQFVLPAYSDPDGASRTPRLAALAAAAGGGASPAAVVSPPTSPVSPAPLITGDCGALQDVSPLTFAMPAVVDVRDTPGVVQRAAGASAEGQPTTWCHAPLAAGSSDGATAAGQGEPHPVRLFMSCDPLESDVPADISRVSQDGDTTGGMAGGESLPIALPPVLTLREAMAGGSDKAVKNSNSHVWSPHVGPPDGIIAGLAPLRTLRGTGGTTPFATATMSGDVSPLVVNAGDAAVGAPPAALHDVSTSSGTTPSSSTAHPVLLLNSGTAGSNGLLLPGSGGNATASASESPGVGGTNGRQRTASAARLSTAASGRHDSAVGTEDWTRAVSLDHPEAWAEPNDVFARFVAEAVRHRLGKYVQPDHPNRIGEVEAAAIFHKIRREVVDKERRAYAERRAAGAVKPIERRRVEANLKEFVRQSIRRFHTALH